MTLETTSASHMLTAASLSLSSQVDKYEAGHFGYCPRVFCHSHPVLPCGRSDLPGLDTVKLYCSNCIDCYAPPSSRFHGVDGAFFGTTFPHLLFQCYRDIAPSIIAPPGSNANSLNLWSTSARGGENEQVQGSDASRNDLPEMADGAMGSLSAGSSSRASTPAENSNNTGSKALNDQLVGAKKPQARLYTPRIYGFRVSEQAKSGPRMRWLRMRPESWDQLEKKIMPVGGGAPERSGTGAVKVGGGGGGAASTSTSVSSASVAPNTTGAGTSMGGGAAETTGNVTNLGRPIAGRGG